MTAIKQSKESSEEEENSIGSDLSEFQVKKSTLSSTGTTSNLSSMVNSRFDAKLEHLLTHYFLGKGNNHEIRKMFSENDFFDFEEFTFCNKQHLLGMRGKR